MTADVKIVRTEDFVRLDGRGHVDIKESRHLLEKVAKSCVDRGIHHALLDVRDVHSDLTFKDLYHLVMAFPEMGFRKNCSLAILHRLRSEGKANFFSSCAKDFGWKVKSFDLFEEAMAWFSTIEDNTA